MSLQGRISGTQAFSWDHRSLSMLYFSTTRISYRANSIRAKAPSVHRMILTVLQRIGGRAKRDTNHAQAAGELLSRAEKWAWESGAVFEAEMTTFIHFVRPL